MHIYPIIMPKWGLSMEEGKIIHWYVAPGDRVSPDDPLVDIETSKITNTIEAPQAGIVRRVIVEREDVGVCGQLLAVIADDEVTDVEIDEFVAQASRRHKSEQHERKCSVSEPLLLKLENHTVRYLPIGGGGVPVVFVHGFGGDLDNWMFNQPILAADRQTIAFDLPGHGGSSKDVGQGTIAELAAILEAAIDALNLGRVHLVGHSLGGAIALLLAAIRPRESTASLSLIAPAGVSGAINSTYIDGFLAAKRRRDLQKVLEMLFANAGLATAEMAEGLLKCKRLDGADEALHKIANASFVEGRQRNDLRSALSNLELPTMILWGTEDRIISVPDDDNLAGIVQRLPDVGHMAHLEAVAAVNRSLAQHFAVAD